MRTGAGETGESVRGQERSPGRGQQEDGRTWAVKGEGTTVDPELRNSQVRGELAVPSFRKAGGGADVTAGSKAREGWSLGGMGD